jgi:hypothetical protein
VYLVIQRTTNSAREMGREGWSAVNSRQTDQINQPLVIKPLALISIDDIKTEFQLPANKVKKSDKNSILPSLRAKESDAEARSPR